MDFGIVAGDTNKTIYVRLRDSSTGLAKVGLAYNSAGAVCSYVLPGAARAAITLATQTVTGSHSDGGFVEVDATNCKGLYRLDLPDAAISSGSFSLVSIEFDGIIEETVIVPLHTRKVNATHIGGTPQTGRDIGASVLLSPGTGTGQVALSSGAVTVGTNSDKTGYSLTSGPLDAAGIRSAVGLASADLDSQLDAIPTAAENAIAVEAAILDEGDATALLAAIAAKVEEFLINDGDATAIIAAIAAAVNSAVVAGTVGTNVAAVKAKTDNLPASPAAVGSAMTLADDAITAAKFDETTAFPLAAASSTLATASALATAASNVSTLLGKFTGITLLAQWLGLIAGKQAGDATALTEIRATGAGSGTFDPTTDSTEAVRDRGDAAWTGSGGGSGSLLATVVATDVDDNNVTLTAGADNNDAYLYQIVVFVDDDSVHVDVVADYVASTNTLTVVGTLPNWVVADTEVTIYPASTYLNAAITSVGGVGENAGSYSDTVTVDSVAVDNCAVYLSTSSSSNNGAYRTYSDAMGAFSFVADVGTYYIYFEKAGIDFSAVNGSEVEVT